MPIARRQSRESETTEHLGKCSVARFDGTNQRQRQPATLIERRVLLMNMSGSSAMRSCARLQKAKGASVVMKELRRVLGSTAQPCFLG